MAKETKRVTTNMDEELFKQLADAAKKEGRSLSNLIKLILSIWMKGQ